MFGNYSKAGDERVFHCNLQMDFEPAPHIAITEVYGLIILWNGRALQR